MDNNSNRIIYLDIIKTFSIILVIYCHYTVIADDSVAGNIVMTCAWTAVPCFMMVSGALLHKVEIFSWKKYLCKLITSYFVICAWRIIYFAIYLIMGWSYPGTGQLMKYVFFFGDIDGVDVRVMWYMIAYMVVLFLYPMTLFLFRSSGKLGKQITFFIMVIAGISGIGIFTLGWIASYLGSLMGINVPNISGLENIFPFQYAHMIFYFLAGAFLFEYKDIILEKKMLYKWLAPLCYVFSIAGLVVVRYINVSLWSWHYIYLENGYRHFLTVIASFSVFVFLSLFDYKGFLATISRIIGSRTLGIYYMHYILLIMCNHYIYKYIPVYFFGLNVIKTIIIGVISTLGTFLLGKIPVVRKLVK